jgi:UDP-N-acetylglucosamine 2-epimerase (non-hydrolysing)
MIRVLTIFGTRPEAIKLAPVIKALEKYPDKFHSAVCVTAQHRDMLDQVLSVFDIKPQYDLNIMKPGQSLTEVTHEILTKVQEILSAEKADVVLVQGDTTTTFGASLASFYQKVRIGHVEAGLRTFDKYQPFPEEINRKLTSVLADYHFAPTKRARENLLREGIEEQNIVVTGNTAIDALFMTLRRLKEHPNNGRWDGGLPPNLGNSRLILVTAHRRENFGSSFEDICNAIVEIVRRNPDVIVVYPVHLNPNVRIPAHRLLSSQDRIVLVEPLEYAACVQMLDRAYLVLTDSGGIQEEAPSLGKPVLVMRNVTERPEAIEAGSAKLVGTTTETIVEEVQKLLDNPLEYEKMSKMKNPFGDGQASERIIDHILQTFS